MIQDFFTSHSYLIGFVSFVLGLIGMPIVIRIAKAATPAKYPISAV